MDFRQFERMIARNGWKLVRTVGLSRQYRKPGQERTVIVTDHGDGRVPVGVLKNLESAAGLSLVR